MHAGKLIIFSTLISPMYIGCDNAFFETRTISLLFHQSVVINRTANQSPMLDDVFVILDRTMNASGQAARLE